MTRNVPFWRRKSVGAKCERLRTSGTCTTVPASHTSCNTGALVGGVRLERSSRTDAARRGARLCLRVAHLSSHLVFDGELTYRPDKVGTASCWKRTTRVADVTHRRRRWIKRHNHHRQGWRFPDNKDFSIESSVSEKQMGASRKDEFCRPVRTSLASAIYFWLALKWP